MMMPPVPLLNSEELFAMWQANFISYVEMQVFEVSISTD